MSIFDFFLKQVKQVKEKIAPTSQGMRFEVGEGLTRKEEEEAREVIKKKPVETEKKSIFDYFVEAGRALPPTKTPVEAIQRMAVEPAREFFKPTEDVRVRDVAREAPLVVGHFAKEVGQSMLRNIASVIGSEALEPAVKPFTESIGVIEKKVPTFKFFTEELSDRLYGDLSSAEITELTGETRGEQVAPIGERTLLVEEKLKIKGKEYEELSKVQGLNEREKFITSKLGETLQKQSGSLAFIAIVGYTGIDLTPWGGSQKNVLKSFKNIDNVGDAMIMLSKMGVSDDLAKNFAPDVVKVKNTKTAQKLFDDIINIQKSTKVTPKAVIPADRFLETMRRPKEVEIIKKGKIKPPEFMAIEKTGQAQNALDPNLIIRKAEKLSGGNWAKREELKKSLRTDAIIKRQEGMNDFYNSLNPEFKIGDIVEVKSKGLLSKTKVRIDGADFNMGQSMGQYVETGFPASFRFDGLFGKNLETGERIIIYSYYEVNGKILSETLKKNPEKILQEYIKSKQVLAKPTLPAEAVKKIKPTTEKIVSALGEAKRTDPACVKTFRETIKKYPDAIPERVIFSDTIENASEQYLSNIKRGTSKQLEGFTHLRANIDGKIIESKPFIPPGAKAFKEDEILKFVATKKGVVKTPILPKREITDLRKVRKEIKLPPAKESKDLSYKEIKLLTSPDIAGKGFVMKPVKKKEFTPATRMKRETAKSIKEIKEKKVATEKIKETKKGVSGFDDFIDITDIKRKAIPYKEMNIAENIVGDKTFPAIRKSGFYADKEIQFAPVRDIYNQKLSPHLMALKQDGYKLGGKFGTVFSKVWKPTEKAIRVEKEFNSKNVKVILDLGKKHKIKATKKNLEYMSDVVEKKVKGTPNEEAYVKELRKTLDELREEANAVREVMGKNKMGYIENYIPHIQKANIWSELLANKATISDNLDFIIPNQTKNPFAFKRLAKEMLKPERNLYTLLDRYIGVIGKDIYYTPAIENIKAYNGVLKSREKIKAAQYWDEYIRQGLIGKQHKIDTALGIGKKTQRVLQKWNDMVNKAFLTGKVAWNIATQPLSYIMNVPMETGIKNSIKGIYKGFRKPLRQYVKENSNVLNIKNSDVHAIAVGEGRNIQNRIYRTKIDKWNDFISMIGSVEERELTMSSYIAGLERAKGLGYKGDDALWFADLTAARTQSMYNRENRALILNSDITRTIFPFQSFSIEMFNHAKEIATKSGGAFQLTNRQRVGKLFGLMVGMYLSHKYSEALVGKGKTTVGTFVPFLGGTVVDPMIAKMKGEQYYGGRSPITVIQIGEDIIKGSQDYIKHGSTKRLRKIGVNFGLALGGMGGGGQINNLIDGIMANIDEDVKNVSGDVMFKVEDLESKIKAPIFGVWATKEGIEYWKPKEKTPYDKAISEDKEKDKEIREKFRPKFNEIQKVKETDQGKADEMVERLSDEEWEIYKKLRGTAKTKTTNELKEEFYPTFLKIQEAKKRSQEEADRMVEKLSDEEWRIYGLLKAQLE